MKKTILLSLIIFCVSLFSGLNTQAANNYSEGSLLALEGVQDAAVYYIAGDGMKYVFPDSKTYYTWYTDFSDVIKVDVAELDMYEDGGVMPYRAGTKLITHMNTAKIYAFNAEGEVQWISSAGVAVSLYGDNWTSLVQDVIPGYFAEYTKNSDLSDKHPTGTLINNEQTLYYVEGSKIRPFSDVASLTANNIDQTYALDIEDVSKYTIGDTINRAEAHVSRYSPGWVCCTLNAITPYVYIYLTNAPLDFDPNNIDQYFIDVIREVNLDSDATEDKIQSALQELFSINEFVYGESGYANYLYLSDLTVASVENSNEQIIVNLENNFMSIGVLADIFMKPQIIKTIEYYTDNYIIKLNGTESEWECALDVSGNC